MNLISISQIEWKCRRQSPSGQNIFGYDYIHTSVNPSLEIRFTCERRTAFKTSRQSCKSGHCAKLLLFRFTPMPPHIISSVPVLSLPHRSASTGNQTRAIASLSTVSRVPLPLGQPTINFDWAKSHTWTTLVRDLLFPAEKSRTRDHSQYQHFLEFFLKKGNVYCNRPLSNSKPCCNGFVPLVLKSASAYTSLH